MLQALTGDRTDNYPGVEVGPVRAQNLLNENPSPAMAWQAIVKAFGDERQAITMMRLARILRADDYNIKTGERNYGIQKRRNG